MTCPAFHAQPEEASIPTRIHDEPALDDITVRFEEVAGSLFILLFSAALHDQTMMPEVSAALEATGRFRDDRFGRGLRTAASEQIILSGDDADRQDEWERLRRLHADVKGVSPDGLRYSALQPDAWNLIMISTFLMHRAAYVALTGDQLTPAQDQAVWDWFRDKTDGLQLPGRSRLIEDYEELCVYYDRLATEELTLTPTLELVTGQTLRPQRPPFVPIVLAPAWWLVQPALGHMLAVVGFGSMRPAARAHVPLTWSRRHHYEYTAMTTLIRWTYRALPSRLTDSPLAKNRRQYERLMAKHKEVGLNSFLPAHTHAEARSSSNR